MHTHLVSYDLNRPGQNYPTLIEELKSSYGWWHYLGSTWLIVTSESAIALRDRLSQHIDTSDRLLVINASNDAAAWTGLPERAGEWIKANL